MSDWLNNDLLPVSDSFDHDFGQSQELTVIDHTHDIFPAHVGTYDFSNDFLDYKDPLKHAYKHQFQPFSLDVGNNHFVNPHFVEGYFRQDGTYVEGYYRDGDGNTAINRPLETGGGYLRTNPDGNPFNNLG